MKTDNNTHEDNDFYILQGTKKQSPFYRKGWFIIPMSILLIIGGILCYFFCHTPDRESETPSVTGQKEMVSETAPAAKDTVGKVSITQTEVNGCELRVFSITNATATLHVGSIDEDDATILMAVRATDVRSDNHQINGAFVYKGQLVSQGKAKKGFCAILQGKVVIGAADNSPYLEEAINDGGYFFRQYPLVVDGMAIDNKPAGKSLRRALCEKEGQILVVESAMISFHDFAQALVDYGVDNAIYLVGGDAFGFYRSEDGQRHDFGDPSRNEDPNITYMVWR